MLSRYANNILNGLPANRLLAIDAFRGLTIVAMILVNNPGSWSHVYAPLLHAKWHGWTPTDLIFPFFVFIVGLSIKIAIDRQLDAGQARLPIIRHAMARMLKLVLLGWFLALFFYNFRDPSFSWIDDKLLSMRIPGVLQRLGLVYFFTVLIVLYWRTTGRIIWALLLALGYWAMLAWVPYSDGQGHQYQGLYAYGNNLASWVDHMVLGAAHVYDKKATPFVMDPEGILSTLPAIAGCLSGVLAGQFLMNNQLPLLRRITVLLLVGLTAVIVSEAWHSILPINKALWTPSFVLLSSGYACLVLGLCLWLIDHKGIKAWTAPFVVFGANAIAFYMFAAIVARLLLMFSVGEASLKGWLYTTLFQPLFGNYNGSLAFALTFLAVSYAMMHWMYKKGWFWKV
ncbi:acyltransferase family protein [Bowmanella denitrificans]|uniref:acyltransferase family protein n=1 Tax=Bowmanella denitrificans TaxID=366582 RepID=UPI000C9CFA9F|nr:DUF5009 domain-containing protein [Bowmanella denitrificans]